MPDVCPVIPIFMDNDDLDLINSPPNPVSQILDIPRIYYYDMEDFFIKTKTTSLVSTYTNRQIIIKYLMDTIYKRFSDYINTLQIQTPTFDNIYKAFFQQNIILVRKSLYHVDKYTNVVSGILEWGEEILTIGGGRRLNDYACCRRPASDVLRCCGAHWRSRRTFWRRMRPSRFNKGRLFERATPTFCRGG